MTQASGIALSIMVLGALAGAFADARTRRIPNTIPAALAICAIVASVFGGPVAIASTLAVMIATFALGTVAFSLGWFGGGDVKLLTSCCGLAGFPGAVSLIAYIFIAGGFVSLIGALHARKLREVVASAIIVARTGLPPNDRITVPYAFAIAIGTIVYVASLTYFHALRLSL